MSFHKLPPELHTLILCGIPDRETLVNTILVSKELKFAFERSRDLIISHVASNEAWSMGSRCRLTFTIDWLIENNDQRHALLLCEGAWRGHFGGECTMEYGFTLVEAFCRRLDGADTRGVILDVRRDMWKHWKHAIDKNHPCIWHIRSRIADLLIQVLRKADLDEEILKVQQVVWEEAIKENKFCAVFLAASDLIPHLLSARLMGELEIVQRGLSARLAEVTSKDKHSVESLAIQKLESVFETLNDVEQVARVWKPMHQILNRALVNEDWENALKAAEYLFVIYRKRGMLSGWEDFKSRKTIMWTPVYHGLLNGENLAHHRIANYYMWEIMYDGQFYLI